MKKINADYSKPKKRINNSKDNYVFMNNKKNNIIIN